LFASWTLCREVPHVVTLYRSSVQDSLGILPETREAEDREAFQILDARITVEQWPFLDSEPDPPEMEERLRELESSGEWGTVYAPAWEEAGHHQHNTVALLADAVFGPERVVHYMTYTPAGKSVGPVEVHPELPWVALKLRALACYRSQIETVGTGCMTHFLRPLFEYLAA
jgi:LmbE family N-acetylglucosaminyl deacetylase